MSREYDVAVVDEIQMVVVTVFLVVFVVVIVVVVNVVILLLLFIIKISDRERGYAWTRAV